ncbi:hypothetical protein EFA69_14560 [Rufibacter immobilis]|uniref:Arm DNA-binding domain-containing protein n=1 Tax=Rufibacter immobilis TaxID=1348778 RepID=A0A3M9MP99_9BACT|nr:hypothetical protein [Rufibacter immobilis]RNI27360.1 hypothetical protein EFA69_14560 [Rufibacter immobilis]
MIEAHPRENKDKTVGYLNILYRYDYKHYFSLGIKIQMKHWDSKKKKLNPKVKGSAEINDKINEAIRTIEFRSNSLMEKGEEPTVALVKEYWDYCQAGDKWHKERDEANKPMFERIASTRPLEIEELEALLAKKKRELDRALFKLGRETPDEVTTPSAPLMLEMLYKYIRKRTGVPLEVTQKNNGDKFSGVERQWRSWANTLIEFTKSKHAKSAELTFDLQNLNGDFYDAYAAFLMNPETYDLFNNTFGAHVKKLKTFLRWCDTDQNKAVDRRYKDFKILEEKKTIVCFTIEEIDLLWNWKPTLKRAHKDAIDIQKYIDFTVFSFLTGFRISDVLQVQDMRIDGEFLKGTTIKTNNHFKVPLLIDDRILEILNKYNFNLRLFSDTEYNRSIKGILKEFCKEHDLRQDTVPIKRFKLKKGYPTEVYFWDEYSSHCNRRGFVSYAYDMGYDIKEIKEIIGTSSDREIEKYLKKKENHLTEKLRKIRRFQELEELEAKRLGNTV